MLSQLFSIVAPIILIAGAGYLWARSGVAFEGDFVRRAVMYIGTPALVLSTLYHADLQVSELARAALACAAVVGVTLAVFGAALKFSGQDLRTALGPAVFPNCGNMGLPLALFAFGDQGLALALAFFVAMSLAQFTIGVFIYSGRGMLASALSTPVPWVALVAVLILLLHVQLPAWIINTVDLLGGMTIPLMLLTLGVSLASIRTGQLGRAAGIAALRLVGGFAAGYLVVQLLDAHGVLRGVILLQASMPAAVFNYLLALQYRRQAEIVAGVVIVSTLASFVTLPALVWYILGAGAG